ncbi:MAG: hypothetical protein K8R69_09975 [Deltaproteobacteria bacterium]|nr:hypothetical protein [Deltaproteobacteria bacterium]
MKIFMEGFLKVTVLVVALSGCAGFAANEKSGVQEEVSLGTTANVPDKPSVSLQQEPLPQKGVSVESDDADDELNSPEIAQENTNQAEAPVEATSVGVYHAHANSTSVQSSGELAAKGHIYHEDLEEEPRSQRSTKVFP